ncbi:hypothetical protein Gohar_009895 [Gossypium harknessii]|uniref:Uncharacterized protein n=1 Tax=Gossypium harknessii TaxID=34285 RepID=A0A7J9GQJ8_9ROSI|nr:hypothetical protein [Gossypium harknessii]
MGFSGGSPAQLRDTLIPLLTKIWLWFGQRTHCMTTCLILRSIFLGQRWFSPD